MLMLMVKRNVDLLSNSCHIDQKVVKQTPLFCFMDFKISQNKIYKK